MFIVDVKQQCNMYRGIETQGHGSYVSIFHLFFFLSLYNMLTLKICKGVFSEKFKARMLKLCIHMDNELLNCRIENQTACLYSSLYLSIFLSFKAKFVSQFSPELCKPESSNMVYICRMSDCIVMALIFFIFQLFFSFPILHVNIKFVRELSVGKFKARMLKHDIHMCNELL